MPIALVTSVSAASVGGANVTTAGADTTGATLLVVGIAYYSGAGAGAVSDSKGNTWTALTLRDAGGPSNDAARLYYCANPTVGAGHTFTLSGPSLFGSILALAFSGTHAVPFDVENGALSVGTVTSLQPGSVTPSANGEVVVSLLCLRGNAGIGQTPAVNGGFTKQEQRLGSGGNNLGGAIAYLIQTTAAAANPTWSVGTADNLAAVIATFKAAGNRRRRVLIGGGH